MSGPRMTKGPDRIAGGAASGPVPAAKRVRLAEGSAAVLEGVKIASSGAADIGRELGRLAKEAVEDVKDGVKRMAAGATEKVESKLSQGMEGIKAAYDRKIKPMEGVMARLSVMKDLMLGRGKIECTRGRLVITLPERAEDRGWKDGVGLKIDYSVMHRSTRPVVLPEDVAAPGATVSDAMVKAREENTHGTLIAQDMDQTVWMGLQDRVPPADVEAAKLIENSIREHGFVNPADVIGTPELQYKVALVCGHLSNRGVLGPIEYVSNPRYIGEGIYRLADVKAATATMSMHVKPVQNAVPTSAEEAWNRLFKGFIESTMDGVKHGERKTIGEMAVKLGRSMGSHGKKSPTDDIGEKVSTGALTMLEAARRVLSEGSSQVDPKVVQQAASFLVQAGPDAMAYLQNEGALGIGTVKSAIGNVIKQVAVNNLVLPDETNMSYLSRLESAGEAVERAHEQMKAFTQSIDRNMQSLDPKQFESFMVNVGKAQTLCEKAIQRWVDWSLFVAHVVPRNAVPSTYTKVYDQAYNTMASSLAAGAMPTWLN